MFLDSENPARAREREDLGIGSSGVMSRRFSVGFLSRFGGTEMGTILFFFWGGFLGVFGFFVLMPLNISVLKPPPPANGF